MLTVFLIPYRPTMRIGCFKSRRTNAVTTDDSGKDDIFSWQFTGVIVVVIVVLVTFTPVVIFVHGKITISEARSCCLVGVRYNRTVICTVPPHIGKQW